MPIISSLSEINAVLTATYNTILQSIDDRFIYSYQTVFSPLGDWDSIRDCYYLTSKKTEVTLPFAAMVRDIQPILNVDQGGGYRQWDGDWIDSEADVTLKRVNDVVIRNINLMYELNIFTDRMETAENLVQGFILRGTPRNQSLDFYSDALQMMSRVSFVGERPYYKRIPSRVDKTKGSGYLYQLGIPIKVSGIIGTQTTVPRILEVQGNIYARIPPAPTQSGEGDHVSVTWDVAAQNFKYDWSGI